MLQRDIPEADLAVFLECAVADALSQSAHEGKEAEHTDNEKGDSKALTTQIFLFHEAEAEVFMHFVPNNYAKELDGKGFDGHNGEYLIAACAAQPDLGSKETLLCETLESILKSAVSPNAAAQPSPTSSGNTPTSGAAHIIVAADLADYGTRIKQLLADYPAASVTLLTLDPDSSSAFRTEQIGFPLMAALGIRGDELL